MPDSTCISRLGKGFAVWVLLAALAVAMQCRSGAFRLGLASDPDEPAHAVSSLAAHDYLAQAFPHNPMAFGKDFYAHYPKLAILHWPPGFYAAEGLWMLAAGRSRMAMLLFVALCGATLAWSLYWAVRREGTALAALVSVAVLMETHVFQNMLCGVRPDMLLALAVFWAAFACGEFMGLKSQRSGAVFVLLMLMAVLVHPRGAVLLFLPFCLLPLRKPVYRWKWWSAGGVIAILLLLPPLVRASDRATLGSLGINTVRFLWHVLVQLQAAAALMAAGCVLAFRERVERPFWAAMAALSLCGLLFYVTLPVGWDNRFLMPTLAGMCALAGGGAQLAVDRVGEWRARWRRPAGGLALGLAVIWLAAAPLRVAAKSDPGYRPMMAACLLCGHDVMLVDGGPIHEGALIVEASLADPARRHTVLRGSKLLAHSTWAGNNYRLVFGSAQAVLDALAANHVSLVVVETASTRPEVIQLRSALAMAGSGWSEIRVTAQPQGVSVYGRTGR